MIRSMWSYPWDFTDCGIPTVLDELKSCGINDISMITAYHAGRFLQVRSPKRKVYFPEDGTLYYNSDLKQFEDGLIQPKVSSYAKEHPDFWQQLKEEADKREMTLSGWTVCLHNTRIGMCYPETTVHNAFGDAVYYNLCPSNPYVREYMKNLLHDIEEHVPVSAIQLESMNYMGHAHEFHHEKDGIGLTPVEDLLLSLCFCDSCKERAKRDGLDISGAQKQTAKMIMEFCNKERGEKDQEGFAKEGVEYFKNYPEIYAYLKWRGTVVTSLMEEIRAGWTSKTKIYFLSLLAGHSSWLFGVDLPALSKSSDGIVLCSYDCSAEQGGADIRGMKKEMEKGKVLLTGMRAFYPEYRSGEEFEGKIRAAIENGTDGFVFYNYGLIPRSQLEWISRGFHERPCQNSSLAFSPSI